MNSDNTIKFDELLLKNNKKCFEWFIKLDELKKAKVIEETYNLVYKLSNFHNNNSYTLGMMQEYELEKFLIDKKYTYKNSSKEAKSGDFIVTHNNINIIIESKNYSSTVPFGEIDKLIRDMDRLNIDNAIFISNTNISKINNRIHFQEIHGKYIYFINMDNQPVELSYHIIDMCIHSLSCLKDSVYSINQSIPDLIKRLSENMSILYDFKELLSNTKYTFLKKFDELEKYINLYEYKIRKNINELKLITEPKISSKDDAKILINGITDLSIKNFLMDVIDNYVNDVSINDNAIFFGETQIELRKRKPLFKFKISDNEEITIRSSWEMKNKIIIIPLLQENFHFIRNKLL